MEGTRTASPPARVPTDQDRRRPFEPPVASRREDVIIGIGELVMLIGLYVDGWAHVNDRSETVFSEWHRAFYAGLIASALWHLNVVQARRRDGRPFRRAIPAGYGQRMIGLAAFGFGGVLTFASQTVFGIAVDVEGLLAPSQLLMFLGATLLSLGGLTSAFAREGVPRPTWASSGLIVGMVTGLLSLLQYLLLYLSPFDPQNYTRQQMVFAERVGGGWMQEQFVDKGVAAVLVFTFTNVFALLWLVRRMQPPRGALGVMLIVPAVVQCVLWNLDSTARLLGPIGAGLVAELSWGRIRTHLRRPGPESLWVAVLVALTWFGLMAGVAATDTLGWKTETWVALPILAALLAAFLALATRAVMATSPEPLGECDASEAER